MIPVSPLMKNQGPREDLAEGYQSGAGRGEKQKRNWERAEFLLGQEQGWRGSLLEGKGPD